MSNELDKPKDLGISLEGGKLTAKATFADRAKAAAAQKTPLRQPPPELCSNNRLPSHFTEEADAAMVPNRIALMCDCSGSMYGQKNKDLHTAIEAFAMACNFGDTSVGLATFGCSPELVMPLSRNQAQIISVGQCLPAEGGTPMRNCMTQVIEYTPLTRGLLISDGQATDWYSDDTLDRYVEAKIPVDCVHVGDDSGEALLQKIAERTGGMFIKFKDSTSFARSFKFLAPSYRAMLGDGGVSRALAEGGADEVRR